MHFFIVTILQKENLPCGLETFLELILYPRVLFLSHSKVLEFTQTPPLHKVMLAIVGTSAHHSLSHVISCHSCTLNRCVFCLGNPHLNSLMVFLCYYLLLFEKDAEREIKSTGFLCPFKKVLNLGSIYQSS